MTQDVHTLARQLICDGTASTIGPAEQAWLEGHVAECTGCRAYADSMVRATSILKMRVEAPSRALVRATQQSVRRSAVYLGEAESQRRMLVVSSLLAAVWGIALQPYLWRLFGWAGAYLDLPGFVWQSAFVAMWLVPGIATVLLLAHVPLPVRLHPRLREGRKP